MKKTTLLSLILFMVGYWSNLNAQTEFIKGINNPVGLLLNGNDLYIAENGSGNILKVDLSQTTLEPTKIATGLKNPARLVLNGTDLYISEYEGNRILKLNLANENPEIEVILSNLKAPDGMVIINDELYFVEYGNGTLSKINLKDSTPTITQIIRNLEGPRDITFYNDQLYITESNGGLISKINLNEGAQSHTDIITGFTSCYGITIKNDNIFLTQRSLNQVTKINLNNLQSEILLSNINECVSVVTNDDGTQMYIASYTNNTIYKYEKENLSIKDFESESGIQIYPNPASSTITLKSNIDALEYKIYNILGKAVLTGKFNNQNTINIEHFNSGLYFIKAADKTLKFIKI